MTGEKILILNHTRLGDLVQTTPLIAALKEADPTCHITLLANVKFVGILDFITGVDETIIFDAVRYANDDGSEPDLLRVYDDFKALLDRLESERFDRVVNLSHSKLSAILALACKAKRVTGFDSTDRGERIIRGAWLSYFSTLLSFRKENRFNLVDLYIKAGGGEPSPAARLTLTPTADGTRLMNERLQRLGVDPATPLIGIQAGASREDRRWPPASFATVADRLAQERGATIVLLGAPSEKRLGDQVAEAMTTEPINLIGETSLSELVSWVGRLSLLVTNDTGTMHIGAALDVPVVALFFVHAWGAETGPYTERAIILQADIGCAPCSHQTRCDHYSCLRSTTPDDVIDATRYLLDGRPLPPRSPERFAGTVALRPLFSDDDRMIDLWPLHPIPLTLHELAGRLLRPTLVAALNGWDEPTSLNQNDPLFIDLARQIGERYAPPSDEVAEQFERFVTKADRLALLAEEGVERATAAMKPGADLPQMARALGEIDERIDLFGQTDPLFLPLTRLYRRRVEEFAGDDAGALLQQGIDAYGWLASISRQVARSGTIVQKELMLHRTTSDMKASTVE